MLEKIPLAGIARVVDVSEVWLQGYGNAKYAQIERQVTVSAQQKGRLTLECDEAWSFVGHKGNKQWVAPRSKDAKEVCDNRKHILTIFELIIAGG